MNSVDAFFYLVYGAYLISLAAVLYRLRRQPLYEPRVLFSLAASMWLLIIHGYLIDFYGYLAAKPGFYEHDIRLLSAWALSLMLIGYLLFVAGASVGQRVKVRAAPDHRDETLLIPVCVVLIGISILNFVANVVLISGGNLIQYLGNFALRPYEIQDNAGVTASGYLLGFLGVQLIAYMAGRKRHLKKAIVFASPGNWRHDNHTFLARQNLPNAGVARCLLRVICDGFAIAEINPCHGYGKSIS